jgi:NAD(P)-dependent dehydrogenase (short-subunit alcohol dehydrogenase family)
MPSADASQLLRENLLAGAAIVLARVGASEGSFAAAVEDLCGELGAKLAVCELAPAGEPAQEDSAVEDALAPALARLGSTDMLIVDAAGLFVAAGSGRAMLMGCLQTSWSVTHSVVNRAFLVHGRGGRILYIAPAPGAGAHAEAARAGLENLARTLSIEWARHGITLVTIAPGASTPAGELAALCAYLASPAGAYFSGCLLDLRGPRIT